MWYKSLPIELKSICYKIYEYYEREFPVETGAYDTFYFSSCELPHLLYLIRTHYMSLLDEAERQTVFCFTFGHIEK